MQVLYDKINSATKAKLQSIFKVKNISQLFVGTVYDVWMEEAYKIRAELEAEGLDESVKEINKIIEIQSKFIPKE